MSGERIVEHMDYAALATDLLVGVEWAKGVMISYLKFRRVARERNLGPIAGV